jgi:RsiW-degrading membrane proteinase PrsW (M82 family)
LKAQKTGSHTRTCEKGARGPLPSRRVPTPSADSATQQAASSKALGPAVATTPFLGDTERTERINWVPALVLVAVATVLDLVVVAMQISANLWDEPSEVFLLLYLSTGVAAVVFCAILHYDCWHALPVRFRATSPGKAVGYMFVPFFNFY